MIPFKVHGTEFYTNSYSVKKYRERTFIDSEFIKVNKHDPKTWRYYQKGVYKLLGIVPVTNKYYCQLDIDRVFEDGDPEYAEGTIARTKFFI